VRIEAEEPASVKAAVPPFLDSDSKAPRRTSGRKSIDAETRARLACAKQYGKEAVGQRVSLFWAGEDRWFDGTVKGYSLADGQHCVKYDDGDQWHYHLGREETLGYLSWLSLEAKAATSGGERPLASSATRQRKPRGDVQPEEPQQKRQVAAAEEAAPKVVTEAEGLKLRLSSSNSTGYTGVFLQASGKFQARHERARKTVYLGTFATAVEAAVAYARHVGEGVQAVGEAPAAAMVLTEAPQQKRQKAGTEEAAPSAVAEAEGLRLHVSSSSGGGYLGVWLSSGRFRAMQSVDGKKVPLGCFDSAEAAGEYRPRAETADAGGAIGQRVLVPATVYPQYACSEQGGRGWEGLIISRRHDHAQIRFLHATGEDGAAYEPVRLQHSAYVVLDQNEPEQHPQDQELLVAAEPMETRLDSAALLRPDEIVTAIVCDGCDGDFELPPGTLAPEGEWYCAACGVGAGARAGPVQEALVAVEDGVRLHLSSSSNTGYRGVWEQYPGRFLARHTVDGRRIVLGTFDTAVEAATAYARAVGEALASMELPAAALEVAEGPGASEETPGLRPRLSNSTGCGMGLDPGGSGRFRVRHRVEGREAVLKKRFSAAPEGPVAEPVAATAGHAKAPSEAELAANAELALRAGWAAGSRLDCYCLRVRQWMATRALDARGGVGTSRRAELLVHYQGSDSMLDEWVPLSSGRLRVAQSSGVNPSTSSEPVADSNRSSLHLPRGESEAHHGAKEVASPVARRVSHLVAQRVRVGARQYLVHWDGYSVEERSWEDEQDIHDKTLIRKLQVADGPYAFVTEGVLDRPDGAKQLGLFARKPIPRDAAICEYRGARIPKSLQQRGDYVLEVSDEPVVIDGLSENIGPFYVPGSCAVYANHSSRPNARIDKRHGGMWLVASEPIAAGQEIRFDFTEGHRPVGEPRETRDWETVRRTPPPPVVGAKGPPPSLSWEAGPGDDERLRKLVGDERLRRLVPRFREAMAADGFGEERLWELIASTIPRRSAEECRQRWQTLERGGERGGKGEQRNSPDSTGAQAGAVDEASSWGASGRARDPASDEPPPKRRSSANSAGAGCVSSASPNNGLVAPLVELPVVTTVPRTAFPATQGGPWAVTCWSLARPWWRHGGGAATENDT